jgi:hypothetical protein
MLWDRKDIQKMKRLVLLALIALSVMAGRPVKSDAPMPQCDPCPFIH